jgi:hypothetical protein
MNIIPIEELEDRWSNRNALMDILPLLEYRYPNVLEVISDSKVFDEAKLLQVVEYSLTFPSRHWALSAVIWMENGIVINQEISDKLVAISKDKSDSQNLRHRAIKQSNRWLRGEDI